MILSPTFARISTDEILDELSLEQAINANNKIRARYIDQLRS